MNSPFSKFFCSFDEESLRWCDAIIIPGRGIHQLDTPPEHEKLRHYLSGFHGSAGTLVIHRSAHMLLCTDARYRVAAEKHFCSPTSHTCISRENDYLKQIQWIRAYNALIKSTSSDRIIACPLFHTDAQYRLIEAYASQEGFTVKSISYPHLLKAIQSFLRTKKLPSDPLSYPSLPSSHTPTPPTMWNIYTVTGKKRRYKVKDAVCRFLTQHNATHLLTCSLHEIAFISGLRSTAFPHSMLFPSTFIIDNRGICTVFVPSSFSLPQSLRSIVSACTALGFSVKVISYEKFLDEDCSSVIASLLSSPSSTLLYDPDTCPHAFVRYITKQKRRAKKSPFAAKKDIRTHSELKIVRQAYNADCVALLHTIDDLIAILETKKKIHEQEVSDILLSHRKKTSGFVEESFCTISAVGKNSAMPHYMPSTTEAPSFLNAFRPFLIDCGAHYCSRERAGTSDITRSFFFAPLLTSFALRSLAQHKQKIIETYKEDYTAVLKAHIALASQPFSPSTTGSTLDKRTRAAMPGKRNYTHGTGHGVGYCTDVHEGDVQLSTKSTKRLRKNMILSNEPAYYSQGRWGIRLENLVRVAEFRPRSILSSASRLLCFETLTYFPFQETLVNRKILQKEELEWFDTYQRACKEMLAPYLTERTARLWNTHLPL